MRKNLKIEGLGSEVIITSYVETDSPEYKRFLKANRVRAKAKGTSHHQVAQELYLNAAEEVSNLSKRNHVRLKSN